MQRAKGNFNKGNLLIKPSRAQKIFGAVGVILLLTAAGTVGYYKYNEYSLQAKARGLSLRFSNGDYSVKACKVWFSEGRTRNDPPIYVVRAYYDKRGTRGLPYTYIRTYDYRREPLTRNFSQQAWYFNVSFMQMYATRDGYVSFDKDATSKISMFSIDDC
jgi:hypothetical protein